MTGLFWLETMNPFIFRSIIYKYWSRFDLESGLSKLIFSLFWEGAFIRRGAFIRGGAFILKSEILGGRSFEGGVYSGRGVYSRKYGNRQINRILGLYLLAIHGECYRVIKSVGRKNRWKQKRMLKLPFESNFKTSRYKSSHLTFIPSQKCHGRIETKLIHLCKAK